MSLEGVAARAGVGKTTIYRRWPSKEALVIDAMRTLNSNVPIIDTGDLRADLTQMMYAAFRAFSTRNLQKLLLRALVEIDDNPALMEAYRGEIAVARFNQMVLRLQRARERGEMRSDFDLDIVIAILGGPIVFHMMLNTFIPTTQEQAIDQLIEGIFNGIGNPPERS